MSTPKHFMPGDVLRACEAIRKHFEAAEAEVGLRPIDQIAMARMAQHVLPPFLVALTRELNRPGLDSVDLVMAVCGLLATMADNAASAFVTPEGDMSGRKLLEWALEGKPMPGAEHIAVLSPVTGGNA